MFVDSDKGNNSNSCASRQLPCKDIRAGFKKVVNAGTLYIKGTHFLTSTIEVTKSITITSDKEDEGVIRGNGLIKFAFTIMGKFPRGSIRVKLSNMHFDTIGMMSYEMIRTSTSEMECDGCAPKKASIIEIENITTLNTWRLPKCTGIGRPCSLWISGNPDIF